jgi:membrane-associated phospholipid phosphatase
MNKIISAGLLLLALFATSIPLAAQYTDALSPADTARTILPRPAIDWNTAPIKKVFPYKSFLLPATLVVYGIVSLHTDGLQDINEEVKEEVYTERSPRKLHIDNYLQWSPALAVYGLNAAGIHGKNNFRDRTIIYGMSELIMSATVFSVKKITGETRPDGSDNLSFPSGHTANAFAAAEFLRQEYKDVSPLYGIAGYVAAAVTGYLRVSNNKHWAGDVVAGAGVGIISTKLAYWMYPAIKRRFFKNKDVNTMVMPSYQNRAFGLGLVHHF